jgi:ATP/maltotriose-dependent transcriptional regulator MalT/DNA-binding SARP family transcriptional activator
MPDTHALSEPAAGGDAAATRVIRSKVSPPPLPSTAIRRPRVESLLARLIEQHRVLCVYASAGAGKTTAILQAASLLDRPLAWLSIDATDAATGRLLVYLETALATEVPGVTGVAAAALGAKLAHPEVAGLLAEAVGDTPVLLVLDDVERLAQEPDALAVVDSFARYLPGSARLVVTSRSELPLSMGRATALPWAGAIGEEDLAFTVGEATDALKSAGRPDIDPVEAIVETGGWVTGVLFEAWRSAEHVIGMGGEADPLHGYLALQILGQLEAQEREFLITTAVLPEVTASTAAALGVQEAGARLHTLHTMRLPVSWDRNGSAMRSHPRFREYLLQLLARRGEQAARDVHRAYARLLADQHHDEEAVDEFLTAGCPQEALSVIHPALERVIERTDFNLAERWLAQLAPVRAEAGLGLVAAELMLALAAEDYGRGVAVADELQSTGRRDELAATSSLAASLMAWCYLHVARVEDIRQLLATAEDSDELDAVRYAMRVTNDAVADEFPGKGTLTGGPLDALVLRADYDLGRLASLMTIPASPWAVRAAEPWRIGALLATGHIEQAYELFQGVDLAHQPGVWLAAVLGPKLMSELGEPEAAWRLLHEGRTRIAASGSQLFALASLLQEAELELTLNGDTAAARRVLTQARDRSAEYSYACIVEPTSMLWGLTLLLDGEGETARDALETAVVGMRSGDRQLLLPAAAAYLAEAEWRVRNEDAADAAANLALEAAERQGSNHILLDALARFPAVLSRRLDMERSSDSPWHDLGRALMIRGVQLADVVAASVHVVEFGRQAILVNGAEVQPRLSKSYELLAFLANRATHEASRAELLRALFDGRTDEAAASYLRQAVLRLRKSLPDSIETETPAGRVRLGGRMRVTSESERLVGLLGQAASLRGAERLRALLAALEIADRGPYLSGIRSAWVEERGQHLGRLIQDARYEAAEIAFAGHHLRQAARLVADVLRGDPFRESAWRLEMRIAHALGDQDRVLAVYRECEQSLKELGAEPTRTTTQLLHDLRR